MPQWSDSLERDPAALADFLAWLDKRRKEAITAGFDNATDMIQVAEARGAKKVLDELERCANMNARERRANHGYESSVALSTTD